jgi:ATP-dependent RNA helicase DDX51/DBP6
MLVDILIATPGRLSEHILHTPAFTLQHLEFLVLDEADRLLHQSFQNWIEVVINELSKPKTLYGTLNLQACIRGDEPLPIVGQRYIDTLFNHPSPGSRRVRKLIFSATLTYDIGKLSSLQMHSPETISIQSHAESPAALLVDDALFSLPETLHENVLVVKENKPLFLIQLLDKFRLHQHTLIFTHSTETATRLNHLLSRFFEKSTKGGVSTAVISSEVPLRSRKKLLSSFIDGRLNMYLSCFLPLYAFV